MLRPHIVILGAGFAGTYIAKHLERAIRNGELDVTIVNSTNYFLFTPLLHEVATGALSPASVAEPLREVFAGSAIRIVQGTVQSIDAAKRTVNITASGRSHTLHYDYLVLATGAETNYYGIPGAAELALPLKSLADAALVRNRIIDAFEQAVLASDPDARRALLSFAVVGGGATGVELAAELAEFTRKIVKRYYKSGYCRSDDPRRCQPEDPTVTLVHAGPELLEQFAPSLRRAAHNRLTRSGVKVLVNTAVTAVTAVTKAGLSVAGGEPIPAATIIWAAGVKAVIPRFEGMTPTLSGGRLAVGGSFLMLGSDRIFAAGDLAAYVDAHDFRADTHNVRPLPMLAQVAEAEAKVVAENILAAIRGEKLKDFHYHSRGSMVSVGQWFAIGEILSMNIAGRLTWWLWRTVYLLKFASWRKRIRIAFDWAFEIISPRDITKL